MSKWISVKDKAAPKDGTVCWLAMPPDGKTRTKVRSVIEGYWLDGAWHSTEFGDDELWPPTHWMISRTPPPPKPFTLPKRVIVPATASKK